jgi:hypothetical protein
MFSGHSQTDRKCDIHSVIIVFLMIFLIFIQNFVNNTMCGLGK